jgi:hypothetical protein
MYPDPQQYSAYSLLPQFADFHIGHTQQPGHSTGQQSQPGQQLGPQPGHKIGYQQQSGQPIGYQNPQGGAQLDQPGAQIGPPGGYMMPGRNQPGTPEHSEEVSNGHPGLPSTTDFATYTGQLYGKPHRLCGIRSAFLQKILASERAVSSALKASQVQIELILAQLLAQLMEPRLTIWLLCLWGRSFPWTLGRLTY